jgi:hypothetical protein
VTAGSSELIDDLFDSRLGLFDRLLIGQFPSEIVIVQQSTL